MTTRKILVTSGRWQAALACVQSLGRAGHEVYVLDSDESIPLGHSRFCRGVVASPSEYSWDAYRDTLLHVLDEGAFDVLIPISDAAVDVVAAHQEAIRQKTRVAISTREAVRLSRDKAATCRFAETEDILIPETFFPEDAGDLRAVSRAIDYPCVAKLRRGTGSKGVRICRNAAELIEFVRKHDMEGSWPIVQRYVPGDIYDATAVCDRGQIAAIFTFYSPLRYQVGGTPPYAFSFPSTELESITRRVLSQLEWHGAVDLDFIRSPDGRFYLLELNPRLSGCVNLALKLGTDLPRALLDVSVGAGAGPYGRPYPAEVLFRSVLPMELEWLAEDPANRLATSLRMLVNGRSRTNVYWSDWRLIAAQISESMAAIRTRRT